MNNLLADHTAFETFPAMILTIDLKCTILNCNTKTLEYLGYSKAELMKKSIEKFLFHETGNHFWFYLEQALSGSTASFHIHFIKKSGELLYVPFLLLPYYEEQEVKGAYFIATVALEQKNSANESHDTASKELHDIKFALDQAADISITDANGIIIYTNDRLCKITKYTRRELVGNTHRILNSNFHSKQFFKDMWDTITAGNVWHGEIRNRKKDGTFYWSESTIVPFLSQSGIPYQYIAIRYDITARKELEERVLYQTYYDSLTQLPNRSMLENIIQQEIRLVNVHGKFAVFMLNINRLKFINDTLGHRMGDKLLQAVAQRLTAKGTRHDWKVGRFGGDQFCVIATRITDDEHVKTVADQLIEQFKSAFSIQDYNLYVTANVGVAIFPESGDDSQTLLKNADIALYRSREMKRGSYEVYSSVMDIHTYKQFSLMNDIYNAFKQGEFVLYYQPIVNLQTNGQLAAEALIRWNHNEWALIAPDEFIPLSEETGLIVSITEWVIHEVCKQLSQWQKDGVEPVQISVNLSAHDLMRKDFVGIVKRTIKEYGINPAILQFEITERIVAKNDEVVLSTIKELKNIGIKIALDDFGTGYSSLNLLKMLPVDAVKIDKVFVDDLFGSSSNLKLLKSIIQFVQELDLISIVEGVETQEQLNTLIEFGCNKIQGYLISRPIPVDEFKSKFLSVDHKNLLIQPRDTIDSTKGNKAGQTKKVDNRRKFFRVDLKYPLGGRITIRTIDGRKVNIGKTKILIKDIGPGGIRFISNLKLPMNPNMIFEFETKLFGKVILKNGHIVWGKEFMGSIYEYGLELMISEADRTEMIKVLNNLIVKLRNGPIVPECEFVTGDISKYLSEN